MAKLDGLHSAMNTGFSILDSRTKRLASDMSDLSSSFNQSLGEVKADQAKAMGALGNQVRASEERASQEASASRSKMNAQQRDIGDLKKDSDKIKKKMDIK